MGVCEEKGSCTHGVQNTKGRKDCGAEGERVRSEYQKIHNLIFTKLINTEKNRDLLSGIPNEPVLDLSLIFYRYQSSDSEDAEILVTEEMMNQWEVDYAELAEDAMLNTRGLMGARICPLKDMIESWKMRISILI